MQTVDLYGNPVIFTIKRGTVIVHDEVVEHRSEAIDVAGRPSARRAMTTVQEFWLDTGNGREEHIALSDHQFFVQAGHQVSLCLARIEDAKEDRMVGLVNHTTGKSLTLADQPLPGMQIAGLSTSQRLRNSFLAFLPGLFLLAGFTYIGRRYTDMPRTNLIIGILFALGFLAYGIVRWRRLKHERDTADIGLEQATDAVLRKEQADFIAKH